MGDPHSHTLVVGREAMACRFEVVFNAGEVADATALACDALDRVEEIEHLLSVYRDTSELARVNATAAAGWQPVSREVCDLLVRARDLHDRTGGGFDLAAGSLVRAWGFLARRGRTPGADELAAALDAAGMRHVEIDAAAGRVRFTRPGVELNPGAIGKGWAIDRALERLVAGGVANVLVHGGSSSVRALGSRASQGGRAGWPVGIVHPQRPDRRLAVVGLVDAALGTSGAATQFFVDRGRRLGHILDPRTGRPAAGVLSATVVAPTAAEADALSTALYVLGADGLAVVAPPGGPTAALVVLPGPAAGGVRILTANVPPGMLEIAGDAAVEVVVAVPRPADGGVPAPRHGVG